MAEQKFRIILLACSFINIAFVTHTTAIPDVHAIIIIGPAILAKWGPELFYGSHRCQIHSMNDAHYHIWKITTTCLSSLMLAERHLGKEILNTLCSCSYARSNEKHSK